MAGHIGPKEEDQYFSLIDFLNKKEGRIDDQLTKELLSKEVEDASNWNYYVEDITQQIAEKSWILFVEIEEAGGYLELLKQGVIQKKIYGHAAKEQQWIE